jgi:hypothetical protein
VGSKFGLVSRAVYFVWFGGQQVWFSLAGGNVGLVWWMCRSQ